MTRAFVPPPLPPPRPVEYAPAAPKRFSTFAMVTHLVGWAVFGTIILGLAVFVVPRFEEVFKDFRLDLPYPTKLLLSFSRSITHGGVTTFVVLLLLLPLPFLHAALVGLFYPRASHGARRAYRLLLTLSITGLVLFVILALFLPYISLVESVSGGGGKR